MAYILDDEDIELAQEVQVSVFFISSNDGEQFIFKDLLEHYLKLLNLENVHSTFHVPIQELPITQMPFSCWP